MVAALFLLPFAEVPRAAAADASLVLAALRTLEREYVDPVKPVPLLNAAIATLRKATGLGPDALPDIAPSMSEDAAASQFTSEFLRAAQTGVMPATQLAYLATQGMLESLHDPFTGFLTPEQFRNAPQRLGTPGVIGIGITVTHRNDAGGTGWIFVDHVFPGSPAEAAGVRRFDKILQVDGKPLRDTTAADAIQLILGPPGSTVQLVVQRSVEILQISVVRRATRVSPVEVRWLRPGVAYANLLEFRSGAGGQMRTALERLGPEGTIRAVVLDLRGNPGGLLLETAYIGGIFLPERTVLASVNQRGHAPDVLRTAGAPLLGGARLVVLVDGESAAASEIIAGAFQSSRRATVIGEKSAGLLSGSIIVGMREGGMRVTVERIMGPKNEQIDGVGITPDMLVTLTTTDMERGQDPQLDAALQALSP